MVIKYISPEDNTPEDEEDSLPTAMISGIGKLL